MVENSKDVLMAGQSAKSSHKKEELAKPKIGANMQDKKCDFTVWAPNRESIKLLINKGKFEMQKISNGYWTISLKDIKPGTLYRYELESKIIRPDPASHFQPDGVFGASEVIDQHSYKWTDEQWRGLDFRELIFYEVHVGAFTGEGTLSAMIDRVKELSDLGINAIELMPITQFSGQRNWGYDGVFPFAVHNTYGRPNDLKALVNECHSNGMALYVDFVYNHLGPEGNWLNDFAPYFSSERMTRWGPTINLDRPLNQGVRDYFIENTLHWLKNYHIDGIRLDAVLFMPDSSPRHFLQELNECVCLYSKQSEKKLYVVAESGYNVPKVLESLEQGGYGFSAQWLDDFQHSLFALVTGEREGYYRLYGKLDHLIEVLTQAYRFIGGPDGFHRRRPEERYGWIALDKFVVFSQNHDQVGNRLLGDRLIVKSGFDAAKLCAGIVLSSPYVPLLFMGEEYGEISPFLFFVDYTGKDLRENVTIGRAREFAEFHWQGKIPDPLNIEAFQKSKIIWENRYQEKGKQMLAYYRKLITLRQKVILSQATDRSKMHFMKIGDTELFLAHYNDSRYLILANFGLQAENFTFNKSGTYNKVIDSFDLRWGGPGSSLPDKVAYGEKIKIGRFNFAIFQNLNVSQTS